MPKPPLPISLLTTQSESSDMAESTSIWLQFPFGFGVMKRKRYWRFLVKLRKITIGESSWSESSRLWAVEFREKEKNKEDQGEEVCKCYRRSVKEKKKRERERERERVLWNVLEFGESGREKKKRVRVRVWRRKKEGKKRKKEEGNAITIFSQ